jgi:hypothetical protein
MVAVIDSPEGTISGTMSPQSGSLREMTGGSEKQIAPKGRKAVSHVPPADKRARRIEATASRGVQ